jgi:hypothetical protein
MTTFCDALTLTFEVQDHYQGADVHFKEARRRGKIAGFWSTLADRDNSLLDVDTITQGRSILNCRHLGPKSIRISEINGSEGRCQDFDRQFNPITTHNRNRWNGIAAAYKRQVPLPAVDLLKIGDTYVVRDGHHRISVTKALGGEFIDANVTEWVLAVESPSCDPSYDLRHYAV